MFLGGLYLILFHFKMKCKVTTFQSDRIKNQKPNNVKTARERSRIRNYKRYLIVFRKNMDEPLNQ